MAELITGINVPIQSWAEDVRDAKETTYRPTVIERLSSNAFDVFQIEHFAVEME